MASPEIFQPIIHYSDSPKKLLLDFREADPLELSFWISKRLSTRLCEKFAAKTVPVTTPPCHFQPTNQDSLTNQGPPTSGHIHKIRYGMEERFAFHFPSDDQRPATPLIRTVKERRTGSPVSPYPSRPAQLIYAAGSNPLRRANRQAPETSSHSTQQSNANILLPVPYTP
ncbi:hypothetical protein TNCV_3125841 [Trichonephila clavipes]|nr:hypothetical protein TNCV_3125841 [Trichonephila clavipes]